MTPGARVSAAIAILDQILAGMPAEKALTNWARGARYAGSKDRAAIRDHVFDVLRRKLSCFWLGGSETGRGAMLGLLRSQGVDLSGVFTGEGYAPDPVRHEEEMSRRIEDAPQHVALDLPDWLCPKLSESLGREFEPVCRQLQARAPVCLRANLAKATRSDAANSLAREGIETQPHKLAATALEVVSNARRIKQSQPYQDGLVELQDVASQAVVEALPKANRVLDYCAGGGGKALALAAQGRCVFAHDANVERMKDLPGRAERAGASITVLGPRTVVEYAPFDLVFCDAPCSGSGAWRRTPSGKWSFTEQKLIELTILQAEILSEAADLVAEDGVLAYATCSILAEENGTQVSNFCRTNPEWEVQFSRQFSLLEGGDGFYVAILRRNSSKKKSFHVQANH